MLGNLDVGAVPCTDGECAVKRKLHVAGAGGFEAGGGDLFGDIGGRDDLFGQRDVVVGQEHDLDAIGDIDIVVDDLGKGIDKLDHGFCYKVGRCGLCGKNKGARLHLDFRVFLDFLVEVDDVHCIEQLTLVHVQPLDLNIEKRVGADAFADELLDGFAEGLLVRLLNLHEAYLDILVLGEFLEPLQ